MLVSDTPCVDERNAYIAWRELSESIDSATMIQATFFNDSELLAIEDFEDSSFLHT